MRKLPSLLTVLAVIVSLLAPLAGPPSAAEAHTYTLLITGTSAGLPSTITAETTAVTLSVTLIDATDGTPTIMRFVNDLAPSDGCSNLGGAVWPNWESYSATKSWTLASGAAGTRRVCAQVAHGTSGAPTGIVTTSDTISCNPCSDPAPIPTSTATATPTATPNPNQGATGATGATGPTGPTGPSGPSGPSGPAGATGSAGATGPSGPSGDASTVAGPTGPSGPSGPSGAASTVAGPTGPSGPSGAGASGPSGPSGSNGAEGATGPSGPSGPSGAASTTAGPTGPSGPSGAGADGATGATGPSGPSGAQGATGATGATGPSGPSGANSNPFSDGNTPTAAGAGLIAGSITSTPNLTSNDDGTHPEYVAFFDNRKSFTTSTVTGSQWALPGTGTVSHLYVILDTVVSAGKTRVFTIQKNGTATAVTCTISGATTYSGTSSSTGQSCFDNTHTESFTRGDLIDLKVVSSGGPGIGGENPKFTAKMTP